MKKNKVIAAILFLVSFACLAAGVSFLIIEGYIIPKKPDIELVDVSDIKDDSDLDIENVTPDNLTDLQSKSNENEPEVEEKKKEPCRVPNPYKEYFLQNEDMAAWLYQPNSPIDYPVMWTPEDEEKYLHLSFDKKYTVAGCLLLDTDTCLDPLTTNLIIHGHHMQDGTMFGSLLKYEKQDYWENHKYFFLSDKDCRHIYEVMAVFRSKVYYAKDECFKYYKFFNADTEDEFDYFYKNVKELSQYDTGVEAEFGDRFLTLSTCAYHVQNGRFVVVAKEIAPGEYYQAFEN